MKIVTAQQMRELEEQSEEKYSVTPASLMENAGRGIAEWTSKFSLQRDLPKNIIIICGGGNNGGDGFVSARFLSENGFNVNLILLINEQDLKGPAKVNFHKIKKNRRINLYKITNIEKLQGIENLFKDTSIILDCMLGTGIKGEARGFIREVIEFVNQISGKYLLKVVAVDIPSGMDANTGTGLCVNTYATLTMGLPKVGLVKPGLEDKTGYIIPVDIRIPKGLINEIKSNLEYLTAGDFYDVLHERKPSSHKGKFGHVLVLAGSPQYTGAAYLCAQGALRVGSGLVTLGVPKSLRTVYQIKANEYMTLGLSETEAGTLSIDAYECIMEFLEKADALAIGPGLSMHPDTIKLVKKIISASDKPLVVDADGINAIAEELLVLRKAKASLVLTPHLGEMAKLLHSSVKSVQSDKWKITKELADKYGVTIALKGFHSTIAGSDKKIYINSSGNPYMASGGIGDILTGMISGFLAQGLSPLESAKLGVYLHGTAGDLAASEAIGAGILASDLICKIPFAISSIVKQ